MFTYYKSIATNNVSFGYTSILLEGLTQLRAAGANFYITNEYLCRRPVTKQENELALQWMCGVKATDRFVTSNELKRIRNR